MLVVITYDVNTETPSGQKRLRKIAKACEDYGQRVQKSTFECLIDSARWRQLQARLEQLIDKDKDSLCYYYLGDEWRKKIERVGANHPIDFEGPLIA